MHYLRSGLHAQHTTIGKMSLIHIKSFYVLSIVKHINLVSCGSNLQALKTNELSYESVTPPVKTSET